MDLAIGAYKEEDIFSLYEAFIQAFSENQVSFNPTFEQFEERIKNKLRINPLASSIAKNAQHQIVGFNLHSIGFYQKKLTAYNGGLGVIHGYRNQGIARNLYESLFPTLIDLKVNRILLEVITSNKTALSFYTSIGFQFARTVKCYRLATFESPKVRSLFDLKEIDEIPETRNFDFVPCFIDSTERLSTDGGFERVVGAFSNSKCMGVVVFQVRNGRISQLFVNKEYRRNGVGRALVAYAMKHSQGKLTIMNIPEDQTDTIRALECLGFMNEIDQYEMELII